MLDRTGTVILSAFATIWLLIAKFNHAPIAWLAIALGACISVALVWWILRNRPPLQTLPSANQARIGRIFMWSSIGEGIGIFVAINVLANIGLADRLMAGIALVVGLHFIPPALLVPRRSYFAVAMAMVATSVAGFLIPSAQIAALVVGVLGAITLWTTVGTQFLATTSQEKRA